MRRPITGRFVPFVLPLAAGLSMQRNEAESEEGKQGDRRGIASSCLGNAAGTLLHELLLLESGMHLLAVRTERVESAVGSSQRRPESRRRVRIEFEIDGCGAGRVLGEAERTGGGGLRYHG